MSELETVERDYRALATKVIYGSFKGDIDPNDQRRLDDLADRRIALSAPDLSSLASEAR